MLEFGDVAYCLGYAALKDFFNNQPLRPNPCCNDSYCRKRQKELKEGTRDSVLERLKKEEIVEEEKEIENPFGKSSVNPFTGEKTVEYTKIFY